MKLTVLYIVILAIAFLGGIFAAAWTNQVVFIVPVLIVMAIYDRWVG